ncbi:hypothetical protein [Pseudonocardia yuanmonensis]|uniref:hypothetical protein n=1 Tax=Pseudonocardia yuanmonensis TaxID=1095914 RepID=UPI0031E5E4E5
MISTVTPRDDARGRSTAAPDAGGMPQPLVVGPPPKIHEIGGAEAVTRHPRPDPF